MKTNQMMQVNIGGYTQPIEHKTMLGDLNALWEYGNGLRAKKRLTGLDKKDWLRSKQTLELIAALEIKYNGANSPILELIDSIKVDEFGRTKINQLPPNPWIKTKKGKGGGTWVHLYLMLDAAAWLDAGFKVDIYDTFINHKILTWRDDSGDEFINLNMAIDAYLPGRNNKDNTGIYINAAKLLKAKIAPEENDWNKASYPKLELRTSIERDLCKFLRMGMVRDWEHLKEIIGKI